MGLIKHTQELPRKVGDLDLHNPNPYLKAATSDNTRLAYRSDVRHFERWGGLLPATTESIINYLQHYAPKLNARTLLRRVTALKQWHLYQGFEDPTHHVAIEKTLIGIQRIHGKPQRKAHALTVTELVTILTNLNDSTSLAAVRDHALLQVGYFGALRRSELVSIKVEHLNWVEQGVEILIPQSKTDKTHEGQYAALPFGIKAVCPVTALKAWLTFAKIERGYVFRQIKKGGQLQDASLSAAAINVILKKRAADAGFTHIEKLSSHSFRRGITTSAAFAQASLHAMQRHGRWRQVNTVMGYLEASERFTDNVASKVIQTLKHK